MKRLLPIVVALVFVVGLVTFVIIVKQRHRVSPDAHAFDIGAFSPVRSCSRLPRFLRRRHISQPVMIDLSQKHYTGVALRYGHNFPGHCTRNNGNSMHTSAPMPSIRSEISTSSRHRISRFTRVPLPSRKNSSVLIRRQGK